MRYDLSIDDLCKVVATGVKGAKSLPFSKTFRNMAAFDRWMESNGDNVEIHSIARA